MTGLGRRSLEKIWNVGEMRREAQRLPGPLFDLIDGGAGDEIALRENRAAYDRIGFRARALADVSTVDISTTVLGRRHAMPLLLAPAGGGNPVRLDPSGELAIARAASSRDVTYVLHQAPTYPLEAIAETFDGASQAQLWSQLYLPADRAVAAAVLRRIERAGCPVVCVTVDNPVLPGTRQRDFRNRFTTPAQPYPDQHALIRMGLRHPLWMARYARGRRASRRLFSAERPRHTNHSHEKPVTFDDVTWLRDQWKGRLVIKGIQRGDECDRLVQLGVDGIIVSNHGARYLDTCRATIEMLPEVVEAVGGRAGVFIDGGIMRGTDVVKALALGASAVLVGKAYLYGLAVGGQAGVERVLEIFTSEIAEAMALTGCTSVADIDRSLVALPATWQPST